MSATLRVPTPRAASWPWSPPVTVSAHGAVHRARAALSPLTLESGARLEAPVLQYTLLGALDARRDNLVLVTHALTGTPDVHTWWGDLIGPDRALDTNRVAVLCANVLGGCAGSSGPRVDATEPFPALTTRDQAAALWSLLDALEVHAPALIVGGSLGGMVALELAALQPARCREVLVLAAPGAQTALGAGWHAIMRRALDVGGPQQGLALARMTGMLSYRAPAGLEARFAARDDNEGHPVEAWLGHHGERLVQRFDAASYRALIDAMDRHDVARGRGSLADALHPVADRLTGVGIPGDLLYPDEVVRAWTDAVGARHATIASPHGHDGFLLETAQVATLVQQALARSVQRHERPTRTQAATPVPSGAATHSATRAQLTTRANPDTHTRTRAHASRRIALAGCGVVGDAVAAGLARVPDAPAHLTRVLVRDVHRARAGLCAATGVGRVAPHALTADADATLAGEPDTLIEVLGGLEPARGLIERALRRGVHVITANKALLATHGPALLALAEANGARLEFEAAVGAGIPIVRTLRQWRHPSPITRIEAILNGTTNVVLDAVRDGLSLRDAIRAAQAAGYAEADPSRDLDGRDAEDKVRLLAWLAFGVDPRAVVVGRRGVDQAVARWARLAARRGDAVRLIASVERTAHGVIGSVRPTRVSGDSPWAAVRGVGNRFVVHNATGAVLTLQGDGAGGAATARGVLADLYALPSGSPSGDTAWSQTSPTCEAIPPALSRV
ncbi:MAG TPA: homoserine dehydrogenase [Gemmatimonadaceae bacterium]|nr:homoserine dehydrogenase [Gemmatimonadaceae bacterium]